MASIILRGLKIKKKKKHRPNPNFIPLEKLQGRIAQLTGVVIPDGTIRRWIKNGDLKTAVPSWNRRRKFVTENELRKFIRENSGSEEELSEELKVYNR